ncbi:MAG: hypothetical protein ACRBBU_04515 [Pseudooceanicola sp.]
MVRTLGAAIALLFAALNPVSAQDCAAAPGQTAFATQGVVLVAGQRRAIDLANGWRLIFDPIPFGWRIGIADANGLDLSDGTTPRFGVSPRDLVGWHFRNQANTGPNTGDVNAPQHRRDIAFHPELAGTGGFKSSDGAGGLGPPLGAGQIVVRSMVLSPPKRGERAEFLRAQVDACVTWPKTGTDQAIDQLAQCGVDMRGWTLAPGFDPLFGAFGGGDRRYLAAMLRNAQSETPRIAICLNGQSAGEIGADSPLLPDGLLSQAEAWRVLPRDHGPLGYVDEPPWPIADGDVIAIERIEKSLHLLYLSNGAWRSQQVYRLVTGEP